jgi:hypothetical protein
LALLLLKSVDPSQDDDLIREVEALNSSTNQARPSSCSDILAGAGVVVRIVVVIVTTMIVACDHDEVVVWQTLRLLTRLKSIRFDLDSTPHDRPKTGQGGAGPKKRHETTPLLLQQVPIQTIPTTNTNEKEDGLPGTKAGRDTLSPYHTIVWFGWMGHGLF